MVSPRNAGLEVPLRVLLHHLEPVPGGEGHKGDVVLLAHGVVSGDVPVVLHPLHGELLLLPGLPGLQGSELPAAAGHLRRTGAECEPAAHRAGVIGHLFHIASYHLIGGQVPLEQLFQVHSKEPGQLGQKGHVWAPQAALPFAHRLVGDPQGLRQLPLRHAGLPAQRPDQAPQLCVVHLEIPPRSLTAYQKTAPAARNAP